MSKQENTITKTYKYFDLETFESKEETRDIPFTPAATLDEANTRINANADVMLKALNAYLRQEALSAVEAEVAAKGGRKSVVLAVVKPFRAMPPFDKIENRAEQTSAILDLIKANPRMIEAIKAASLAAVGSDDNNDE